jgi:NADH dehydrogenase (ubiquinone) 1 beta subcomplex subunit 8
MLSQRILARRLPQVAARAIAPRAAFSQVPALRAAEVEDPFQVYTLYGAYTVFPAC